MTSNDTNSSAPPPESPSEHQRLLAIRRRTVGMFIYLLAAVWGIRTCFSPDPWENYLVSLVVAALTTHYCMIDSSLRNKPLPWSTQWLIFLTWMISVPILMFRARGLRGMHWTILAILGYIAAFALPAFLTETILDHLQPPE